MKKYQVIVETENPIEWEIHEDRLEEFLFVLNYIECLPYKVAEIIDPISHLGKWFIKFSNSDTCYFNREYEMRRMIYITNKTIEQYGAAH